MNERIKELAEQAKMFATPMKFHLGGQDYAKVRDEKFAQLIIQDCIRTLRGNGYDDAAQCLQDTHFGIEHPV